MIGDNNVIRNVFCEMAIVFMEIICVSFIRDEFLVLVDKYFELVRVYCY